jgi:hypothetical protein
MTWLKDEIYTKGEKMAKSNINVLVAAVCKLEGGCRSLNAGNAREVIKVLKTLSKDPAFFKILTEYLLK